MINLSDTDEDAIRRLARLLDETGLTELEVRDGDRAVRVARAAGGAVAAVAVAPAVPAAPAATGQPVAAPLTGVFYRAPAPDAAPFVQPGDVVRVGQPVAIIESMKMMNRVLADRAGTVTAVLVDNGAPVDRGQPLFLVA